MLAQLIDDLLDVAHCPGSSVSTCVHGLAPRSDRGGRAPRGRGASGGAAHGARRRTPDLGDPARLQRVAWNLLAMPSSFPARRTDRRLLIEHRTAVSSSGCPTTASRRPAPCASSIGSGRRGHANEQHRLGLRTRHRPA
jgi:hypothetical protein